MKSDIQAEGRYATRALHMAKKEWLEKENEKDIHGDRDPFPNINLNTKEYRLMGTYTDAEKARMKL